MKLFFFFFLKQREFLYEQMRPAWKSCHLKVLLGACLSLCSEMRQVEGPNVIAYCVAVCHYSHKR